MAFTTIPGTGGAPDSFVGSAGVDAITFVGNTTNFFVGAQGDNDFVSYAPTNLLSPVVISNGSLRGGDGDDVFVATDLIGGIGGDVLFSSVIFNNVLFNGNKGDDTFLMSGAIQASTIFGGQGDDIFEIEGIIANTRINGNKGDDDIEVSGSISRSSIFGGQGDDVIFVGDNINTIGGPVFSVISNTLISGDVGDDLIVVEGVLTNVTINGNADDDIIDVSGVLGEYEDDDVFADTFSTGVSVFGGQGDDLITADVLNDGAPTNDGSTANLKLYGNEGDDTIFGGAGKDTITGGTGADTLFGGGGANTFLFATGDSLAATAKANGEVTFGDGVDVVLDATLSDKFILNGLAINAANKDIVTGTAIINSAGNYQIELLGTAVIGSTNTYFHVHGKFDDDGVFEYTGQGSDSALFFQTASGAKIGDKINSTSVEAFIIIFPES